MPLLSLAGKTVAITGSTGCIGSAIAKRFANEGAKLLLLGRDHEKLTALHNSISSQQQVEPNHHKYSTIDFTSTAKTMVPAEEEEFGAFVGEALGDG